MVVAVAMAVIPIVTATVLVAVLVPVYPLFLQARLREGASRA